MHHYHKRTHAVIPPGELCHYGCGGLAHFQGTGGKFTCKERGHYCPAYLKRLSQKVSSDWKNDDGTRLSNTKRVFEDQVVFNASAREKNLKEIAKRRIIKAEDAKNYKTYANKCRRIAQQWARENGYTIGRDTWHVDHKLSLSIAYTLKLDVNVASHPANLEILESRKNSAKGSSCSMTVEQLLAAIERYDGPGTDKTSS